jgi:uncharacterized protein YqjF (DUF2071 family)
MSVSTLLQTTAHRSWPLPAGPWRYYQEWNDVLFLHWAVDADLVRDLIPASLELETFNGKAWISIVAFTMQKIRPRYLPFFKPVSDFHEINVRTYVTRDGKPGVYFINIEAQKTLSVLLSRSLSGLPYEKSLIKRSRVGATHTYSSVNAAKGFKLHAVYEVPDQAYERTALDHFLAERYCLYVVHQGRMVRYHTHHLEWGLQHVNIKHLDLQYKLGNLEMNKELPPLLAHYSKGVQVVAWGKERV